MLKRIIYKKKQLIFVVYKTMLYVKANRFKSLPHFESILINNRGVEKMKLVKYFANYFGVIQSKGRNRTCGTGRRN